MKKVIMVINVLLLFVGICTAQSSNISDYAQEDIYIYSGKLSEIGQQVGSSYYFKNKPKFADKTEDIYSALINQKIFPLLRCNESISLPITMEFVKEKGFFCDGYYCKNYIVQKENSIINQAIETAVKNREISRNTMNNPKFLSQYVQDENPLGTKIVCESFVQMNGRDLNGKEMYPFTFTDTYKDSKGNQRTNKRNILIIFVDKPRWRISDEGKVTEVVLPEKEEFETPFGVLELYRSNINLKTEIPSKISVGTTTSIWDVKDYKIEDTISVTNETELIALYQTRKGYELRNNVCARVGGAYITEKEGEFYIGSIHLVCSDAAWTSVHAEVVKQSYINPLLVDLRFIDGKIVFVIAPKA